MEIILFNFVKRINSTKQPKDEDGSRYQVYLKMETSLHNPTFRLKNDTLPDFNYIKAFGRYYYRTDVVAISENVWDFSCKIDVLASNRNNIGNSRLYVQRASARYDVGLIDDFFPANVGRNVLVETGKDLFSTSGYYVLGLTGKPEAEPKSAVTYYKLSKDELKALLEYFYTDSNFSEVIKDSVTKGFFNPFQYIVSCQWFPFTFTMSTGDTVPIRFGWWNDTGLNGHRIDSYVTLGVPNGQKIKIPRHYSPNNDYRNNEPYSVYKLYIPFFGMINLSSAQLINYSDIGYKLFVDVNTGAGLLRIFGVASDGSESIITDVSSQVGVDIALAQTGMTLGSFAQSAIGGIASAVMGSSLGAVGAIAGASSGVANAASNLGMSENSKNTNGVRTYADFDNVPKLICYYYDCNIEGIEAVGKPLCEYVTINTIPGYIKCANASLDFEGDIGEYSELNAYLNGGFYYE